MVGVATFAATAPAPAGDGFNWSHPLVSGAIAFAVSWGMMRKAQQTTEDQTRKLETLMYDVRERVAMIEGVLQEQARSAR
jgi:hypothetical protein